MSSGTLSRSEAARIAQLSRWAYHRESALEKLGLAREAFRDQFINESEKKLFYARLSYAGVQARKAKRAKKRAEK